MKYVYIIAHEVNEFLAGPCKIGVSENPRGRLSTLQTGNPNPLAIAYKFGFGHDADAYELEADFAERHADQSIIGEWFDIDPKDAARALCLYVREHLDAIARRDQWPLEALVGFSGVENVEISLEALGNMPVMN